MLGALAAATTTLATEAIGFEPAEGFHATLVRALEACVMRAPGAAGARDLGLGTSAALPALLGLPAAGLRDAHVRWCETAAPSHPWARFPLVPRGRFGTMHEARVVRGDLDSTGPIGWAAGDDVRLLASALAAEAARVPVAGAPSAHLRAVAERARRVADEGHALLGFIEFLPPEADGQRQWLVDPECDCAETLA
jgi:hypothetical protein